MSGALGMSILAAAFVAFVLPPVLRPSLRTLGAVDAPNERSSHSRPVLRGAGVAPALGNAVGISLLIALALLTPAERGLAILFAVVGIGASGLGFIEDVIGLPIRMRFLGQLAIGTLGSAAVLALLGGSLWLVPIGAIWVAGYINATNFMDGIDTISALHAGSVGAVFAVLGYVTGRDWLAGPALCLAIASLVFIPWNVRKPGMFLGDAGSYLIGGTIAIIALTLVVDGVSPLAVVGPLVPYLADTWWTLATRFYRGEKLTQAHRTHIYQILAHRFGHVPVAILVTTLSFLAAGAGFLALLGGAWPAVSLLALLAIAAGYLALPSFLSSSRLSSGRPEANTASTAPGRIDEDLPHDATDRPKAPKPVGALPEPRNETWCIVGGSGFIGTHLLAALRAARIEARLVPAPRLQLAGEPDVQSILDAASLQKDAERYLTEAFIGATVIVNAAGIANSGAADSPQLLGANALLPLVAARAAESAGARRFIHLSSAAVQGRARTLSETSETMPFSPYSRSKALAEIALAREGERPLETVILRATSVQGAGRGTTSRLRRISMSRIASVAAPGDQPTPVASVDALCEFVLTVARWGGGLPAIILQPWEGMTVSGVLRVAGGKSPRVLPRTVCRTVLGLGYLLAGVVGARAQGPVRQLEMMWFGQDQVPGWAATAGIRIRPRIAAILAGDRAPAGPETASEEQRSGGAVE